MLIETIPSTITISEPEEEFKFSRAADKSDDVFYCEESDCNFIKNFNHDVDDRIWRVIVLSELCRVLGALEFCKVFHHKTTYKS